MSTGMACAPFRYQSEQPASATISAPAVKDGASEPRYTIVGPNSPGNPQRPIGAPSIRYR